jgi:hypothetical protein
MNGVLILRIPKLNYFKVFHSIFLDITKNSSVTMKLL